VRAAGAPAGERGLETPKSEAAAARPLQFALSRAIASLTAGEKKAVVRRVMIVTELCAGRAGVAVRCRAS